MITVLMGAPGAGKSTWVKTNATGQEYVYCADAIRINKDLDVASFMQWARKKAFIKAEEGIDLICDATHTQTSHRRIWLDLAVKLNRKTKLVVFDTSLNLLLHAQKLREFPAPRSVVVNHHRAMQHEKRRINHEAWDSIEIIKRVAND